MRQGLAVMRRELTASFFSPVAYITMVVFLVLSGGTFLLALWQNQGAFDPPTVLLAASTVVWLTVLIAVVAMRLFAEEKRSGTFETLMTAPLSETAVVLGKYAGALAFILLVMVPIMATPFVVAAFSPALETIDRGAWWGGVLILVLVGGFLLSIGEWISLLTRNQIVAAICVLAVSWLVLLMGDVIAAIPFGSESAAMRFSPLRHVDDFSRGLIDSRTILFYLSGTVFFLFVSVRTLESSRWR